MKIGKWSEKSAYKIPDLRMGLCLLDIYVAVCVCWGKITQLYISDSLFPGRLEDVFLAPRRETLWVAEDTGSLVKRCCWGEMPAE